MFGIHKFDPIKWCRLNQLHLRCRKCLTCMIMCCIFISNVHSDDVNTSLCRSSSRRWSPVCSASEGFNSPAPPEPAFILTAGCDHVQAPASAGPPAHVLTWWSSGADRWRSAMTGCSESDRTIRSGRNGPGRSPAGASPRTAAAAHTDALQGRTQHSEHAWLRRHFHFNQLAPRCVCVCVCYQCR